MVTLGEINGTEIKWLKQRKIITEGVTGKDENFYLDLLKTHGVQHLKKVLVLTVDGEGKGYLQEKGKKYKVFSLGWEGLW